MVLPIDPDPDAEREEKPNLTPLIDIVFLLLVFLILTTRFIQDEEIIGQLLAPQGQHPTPVQVDLRPQVNLALHPGGLPATRSAAELDAFAAAYAPTGFESVMLRSGGDEFLLDPQADPQQQLDALTGFIHAALGRAELADLPREAQDPITIHCFSGLPWRYALWAYDAVRGYERDQAAGHKAMLNGYETDRPTRPISFAPPRIRNSSQHERGRELRDLLVIR
jgi:biopolymer transport protein ExbD